MPKQPKQESSGQNLELSKEGKKNKEKEIENKENGRNDQEESVLDGKEQIASDENQEKIEVSGELEVSNEEIQDLEKVEKREFLEYRKEERKEGGFFDDLYKAEKKDQAKNPLRKLLLETHFHPIYFIATLLIMTLLLLGSWYALENRLINFEKNNSASSTQEAQLEVNVVEENIASSSAEEMEQIKLQVLNGSGKRGEAGIVKTKLEAVGFKDIKTGNDSEWDGEKTEIRYIKGTSQEQIEQIKKVLEKDFNNIVWEEDTDLGGFSVIITTGS